MEPPEDVETVSYTFYVPVDLWSEWKNTLPRDAALHDRLVSLIELDSEQNWELSNIKSIVSDEVWSRWKKTIPQDQDLTERLQYLIKFDCEQGDSMVDTK